MNATLVERNRLLFVETAEPLYDKPEMLFQYWPTDRPVADWEMYNVIGLQGRLYPSEFVDSNGVGWFLKDGSATKPVASLTRTEPIPAPRGKKVRYERGRWERWTQRSGWEPA